jgi:hypothetical protein
LLLHFAALLVQQSEDGEDGSYAYCAMTRVTEAREMPRLNDACAMTRLIKSVQLNFFFSN